jgi:hypothetical protein
MISKKHIRKYLDTLSSRTAKKEGRMSDQVWQELHEYLVKHYKRLDKGARAYADEIFDQLDAGLERKIESLPEGRAKKVLSRKLSIVRAERSPIPVLYLDTPVMENLIRHGLGQPPLEATRGSPGALYKEVLALVRDGRLVCPEDTFRREALEMGGAQGEEGLQIMRRLSEGLSFKHTQTIEDFQIFRALRGFIEGNGAVSFRRFWPDAFDRQTVSTIMKKRPSVVFEGALALVDVATKEGGAHQHSGPGPFCTRLRIRYDEMAQKNEQALQKRSSRHLRDLVRLGMRYETLRAGARKQHLDGFWEGQKTDLAVSVWNYYGGKPEGLEGLMSFFESEIFRDVPSVKIKRDIWNAMSANHPEGLGKPTGPPDMGILAAVLPYTDVMILGPAMTEVVRDMLRLDARFDTEVYSMDEQDEILGGLREVTL